MGMVYQRVLLKLSGEALMGSLGYGIDPIVVQSIAQEVAQVVSEGIQIAIVVGGGNIFRGVKAASAGMDRATADYVGMIATVMNAITLQDALEQVGVPTRVQSAIAMQEVSEPYLNPNARRYQTLTYGHVLNQDLRVMDSTAIALCKENNIPIMVFDLSVSGNIYRAVMGESIGTLVGGFCEVS